MCSSVPRQQFSYIPVLLKWKYTRKHYVHFLLAFMRLRERTVGVNYNSPHDIRILVFWSDSTWCSSCKRNVSYRSTLSSWHILLVLFTWWGNESAFSLKELHLKIKTKYFEFRANWMNSLSKMGQCRTSKANTELFSWKPVSHSSTVSSLVSCSPQMILLLPVLISSY